MKTTTTITTNNYPMLYTDLLQNGHWESFINYVWTHTDRASASDYHSPQDWISNVKGRENEQINQLFERSPYNIYDIVERYFDELAESKKDHCLRCNTSFRNTEKDFCGICGWDYANTNNMEEKKRKQAIKENEQLNAQKALQDRIMYNLGQQFKKIDQETRQCGEECSTLETEKEMITEQIKSYWKILEEKQNQKKLLESRWEMMNNDIKDMNNMLSNADSLYKNFKQLNHSLTLTLRTEGAKVLASARTAIKFPTDLVIALKQVKTPGEIIKHACCYLIIRKTYWQECGENKWSFDLTHTTIEKLARGTYHAQFSHLHLQENDYKIEFVSKKIILR